MEISIPTEQLFIWGGFAVIFIGLLIGENCLSCQIAITASGALFVLIAPFYLIVQHLSEVKKHGRTRNR